MSSTCGRVNTKTEPLRVSTDWGVIAQHFEAMRLLGELTDTMKPIPSMDGQLTLIMGNQAEEQKTSAFTFSQEIIDSCIDPWKRSFRG